MAYGFKQGLLAMGLCIGWAMSSLANDTVIPKELLDLDFQRCVNDCTPGFGEKTCKPLCDCTVAEFQKRLDYSGYLDLSVQLSRADLKPESRSLLDDVARYCTAELDKNGVMVGEPEKKSSTPPK